MTSDKRKKLIDDIGGLRNVDFAAESMQAALGVAEQVIRDAVLEEAAERLLRNPMWDGKVADDLRAMKGANQ